VFEEGDLAMGRPQLVVALAIVALCGSNALPASATSLAPRASVQQSTSGRLNTFDPRSLAASAVKASPTKTMAATPASVQPSQLLHTAPPPMQPAVVWLDPNHDTDFVGSDGRLELIAPAGAITAADAAAAGGRVGLMIRQIAPASGSTAGGSGHVSFGTFLVQVVDTFGGPFGQITSASLGGGTYQYSASYDALGRATDLKWTNGSTTRFEQTRSFDAAGNVSTANTTLPGGTDNQAFCYDEQDRLTWAGAKGTPPCQSLSPGSLTAAQYTQSFAYDTLGRLSSGPLGTYSYGDSAHLHAATAIGSSAWSAAYDGAGNLCARSLGAGVTCTGTPAGAQLTADVEGRLSAWQNTPSNPTSTAGFLYDNQGNRVEQQVTQSGTTTTTVYVGGLEEVATTGSTTTTTTYYYAGALRIAEAVNGVFSYLAADGLGSADVALNASGSATASVLYAPYGGARYSSGTMPTDYGFTGQHSDAVSGLDYYNARYYDPVAGQFSSADTLLPGGGFDLFGLSRYAYVRGNPETLTDPSGNWFLPHASRHPADPFVTGAVMALWETVTAPVDMLLHPVRTLHSLELLGIRTQRDGLLVTAAELGYATGARIAGDLTSSDPYRRGHGFGELVATALTLAPAAGLATSIGRLGAAVDRAATGTVWDSITATKGVYEGTSMPRSMTMTLENGDTVWIHPNVTEHIVERMSGAGSMPLAELSGQAQLTALRATLGQADLAPGVFGQMQRIGRAELMLSIREGDLLPALIHYLSGD
jgi:RHS repeat-associated protein